MDVRTRELTPPPPLTEAPPALPASLAPPGTVEELERLLHSVADQITVWDEQLRLVFANRAVLAWMDRGIEDVRGQAFADFVGPDVAEHMSPYFAAARDEGVVRYKRSVTGPDGRQHAVAVRLAACTAEGRAIGFIMFGVDQTVQADARARQRDATVQAHLLAERERVAARLDEHVRSRLTVLHAAVAETGRQPSDSFPESLSLEQAIDDGIAAVDGAIESIRNAIARLRMPPPAPADLSAPVILRPGSAQTSIPRRSLPAGPANASWSMADALAFVDGLPVVTAWDLDQRNCFANRAAASVAGCSTAEMAGRTRLELYGPEVEARTLPYALAAARGWAQRYDWHVVDGAGEQRLTHYAYNAVYRDSQPVGIVAVLDDIDPEYAAEPMDLVTELTVDRRRIAEDLHDYAIQHLYAAGLALDVARNRPDPSGLFAHAAGCVVSALDALETSVHQLHATVLGGVAESLIGVVDRAAPGLGVAAHLDMIGDANAVDPDLGADLVAVLTEALSNVARHAAADDVRITVSVGHGTAWLRVVDNGRGLDAPTRSSGLTNLRNRATRRDGLFRIRANNPTGTVLDWWVPL